jgi:SAM-dependent methyltransferase
VIFDRTIYRLPAQTQETYWEDTWAANDFANLLATQKNKDWWAQLCRLPPQLAHGELILEAGCGAGTVVYLLHHDGFRVRGVDTAAATIARIKGAYPELDLGVADVAHLDLPDASVGLYVSLGVVEHDPDGPDAILAEAARVTRDEGLAFLTIPYHNLYRRLREPWWRLKHVLRRDEVFYQYAYSRRFIEERLARHGFEVLELNYCHANVAVKKDLAGSWLVRRYTHPEGRYDWQRVKALADRLNRVSPRLMSHVMAITARRIPRGT